MHAVIIFFKGGVTPPKKIILGGSVGIFSLQFWPFSRSVFRFSAVLRFWRLLQFAGFPFISIFFFVFGKYTGGFSDLAILVVFGFPIWFPVSLLQYGLNYAFQPRP